MGMGQIILNIKTCEIFTIDINTVRAHTNHFGWPCLFFTIHLGP